MRIRLALLASLPLLALSLAAHASTLTYNVSGALQTGTYTGTFSVDSSSGLITGGLFTANGISYNSFGAGAFAPGLTPTYSFAYFHDLVGTTSFDLEFALTGGVFTAPPTLCTTTALCGGTDANIFDRSTRAFNEVTSGTVTAPTPEPSSLVLFGTGILGLAGAARRRFLKA